MIYRISISLFVLLGLGALPANVGRSELLVSSTVSDAQAAAAVLRLAIGKPEIFVPKTEAPLTADDVRRIGRDAYVWGWPLVYVHNCRTAIAKVPSPGRSGGMPVAPVNQLCMLTDYIAPTQALVPCPNQDVVYGYGALDLAAEPVVLQVPDFGDRYWVYQLGDQRTDGFAEVGKMYDTKPGLYLIVGPNWQGEVPAGIVQVFRCPTRYGYVLPRVFLDDTAEDRRAILPLVDGIMMYPLSLFGGQAKTYDWTRVRWLPKIGAGAAKGSRRVVPETFFDVLGEVLNDVPPLAGEEARYAELRRVLELSERDASVKQLLRESAVAAEREQLSNLFEFRNFGTKLPSHWTTISNGAAFGRDYLTRAAVAKSNVFVNRNNETKYYYQDLGADGSRLNGSQGYSVTFPADRLPATKGFWSLTLYDANHNFHPNDLDRHSLGTKNERLRYNADGSLTLYIQSWAPAADRQANWIPAPEGAFSLYLRAYWPGQAMLDGSWTPPAVVPNDDRLAVGD
ncbi:MAG: DUF1254 domain-containing protein [Planctomycetia bacterium]|nr:DUF1254 domain-containing protein [Planctomycetia bacterium]